MQQKLPLLTPENTAFWTGGAEEELLISHCADCVKFFHPPSPLCPRCGNEHVEPKPVSGRGQVISYTVNHQPWSKELAVPYVIAIIELEEEKDLRLVSNIINMAPEDIFIDMPVKVIFQNIEDIWLPLFVKAEE